jgi:hypothetical protein
MVGIMFRLSDIRYPIHSRSRGVTAEYGETFPPQERKPTTSLISAGISRLCCLSVLIVSSCGCAQTQTGDWYPETHRVSVTVYMGSNHLGVLDYIRVSGTQMDITPPTVLVVTLCLCLRTPTSRTDRQHKQDVGNLTLDRDLSLRRGSRGGTSRRILLYGSAIHTTVPALAVLQLAGHEEISLKVHTAGLHNWYGYCTVII